MKYDYYKPSRRFINKLYPWKYKSNCIFVILLFGVTFLGKRITTSVFIWSVWVERKKGQKKKQWLLKYYYRHQKSFFKSSFIDRTLISTLLYICMDIYYHHYYCVKFFTNQFTIRSRFVLTSFLWPTCYFTLSPGRTLFQPPTAFDPRWRHRFYLPLLFDVLRHEPTFFIEIKIRLEIKWWRWHLETMVLYY